MHKYVLNSTRNWPSWGYQTGTKDSASESVCDDEVEIKSWHDGKNKQTKNPDQLFYKVVVPMNSNCFTSSPILDIVYLKKF